ncbi:MAG: phosphatidate cytidylyltransferase [Pseudonocardiales bacterium]|jgi:phosphatidate cytidylyltransferase|nr:phosphatidate cytidylyltransferase [Pseudonocardiales bacterium]
MTDRDEPPAGEPAPPTSTGRHGGGSGLSAAELIARSRAASPGAAPRPSRSARRAGSDAETQAPDQLAPTPAADPIPSRHLRVVEALRSGGSGTSSRGGLALVEPADQPTEAGTGTSSTAPSGTTTSGTGNGRHPASPPAEHAVEPAGPASPPHGPDAGSSDPGMPVIAPPPRKPRAGRNLPAAIGVGVALALLVIGTLALYRPSFVVLLSVAVAIGMFEMVTAIGTVEARPPLVPLLAGMLAMETAAWHRGPDGLVGALLLTVLGVTVWRLADGASGYLRDVAAGNLVALYIPFLAGFATLMAHADDGAARIILFILTVVCSDTGGYAVGVLIGKHPMAPTVSPKKSWEGFAGSLLFGAVEGVLMMVFCFHQQWWQGALFGAAIVVTATLGDLGESMIKRDLGLKDMGKLLPGHGGVMDRLDSLLPCAPVAYLLLAAFLPG